MIVNDHWNIQITSQTKRVPDLLSRFRRAVDASIKRDSLSWSRILCRRIRVEHMERQLANLTGLVQKALTHAPHTSPSPREYLQVPPGRDPYARAAVTSSRDNVVPLRFSLNVAGRGLSSRQCGPIWRRVESPSKSRHADKSRLRSGRDPFRPVSRRVAFWRCLHSLRTAYFIQKNKRCSALNPR